MESIVVKSRILSKDLKEIVFEDIEIKFKGLDDKHNMVYTYSLPKYIYDNLMDSSEEFQSYQTYLDKKKKQGANFPVDSKYLKKNIDGILISSVLDTIEMYSQIIVNVNTRSELKKTKKIFISFQSSDYHDRCDWTGGYKGKRVSSAFQFFVGYEVEEPKPLSAATWMTPREEHMEKHYYTLIKHATGTTAKNSTNFQEGNHLEPLYFTGGKDRFLNTYNMIEWTQEREDYLRDLQEKFINLNTHLDSYLSNLDGDKLDLLVSKANEVKLLSN